MTSYKIINITYLIGSREINGNLVLDIEYNDGMVLKTKKLKPSETMYMTVHSLPLSILKLKMKKLISVQEINEKEIPKTNIITIKTPEIIKCVNNIESVVKVSEEKQTINKEKKRNT